MSDIEEDNLMTINDIKKMKKEKKQLSQETKEKRSANMKIAQKRRQEIFKERKNLKLIETNLKDLILDDPKEDIKDNKDIIDELNDKLKPQLKKVIDEKNNNNSNNNNSNNNSNNDILEIVKIMNKRLDKLYTMKKMKLNQPKKEIQPIIIDNKTSENKSTSLLESIRNRMINQY
jgi:hypothetical protein